MTICVIVVSRTSGLGITLRVIKRSLGLDGEQEWKWWLEEVREVNHHNHQVN